MGNTDAPRGTAKGWLLMGEKRLLCDGCGEPAGNCAECGKPITGGKCIEMMDYEEGVKHYCTKKCARKELDEAIEVCSISEEEDDGN
jgi:hypothetical protein